MGKQQGGSRMRVTTRMLDEAAIRAGFPVNHNSLLNYFNNGSMENTLLSALNKRNGKMNLWNKENGKTSEYENLDQTADQLLKKMEIFMAKGKDSIFEKAKESGNKDEICTHAEEMVKKYNSTMQALKKSTDFLSEYYQKKMNQTVSEQKDTLGKIGIMVETDGTLKLDQKKFQEADIETIEKVLGSSGSFSVKVDSLAEKISDHAEANVKAVSSQYNASGDMAADFISRYNFYG